LTTQAARALFAARTGGSGELMSLTVAIARQLSRTGNLIQIYSAPEIFESRLESR